MFVGGALDLVAGGFGLWVGGALNLLCGWVLRWWVVFGGLL